jgi:hypothetical protein
MSRPEYQLQDGTKNGVVLYCFEDERPMKGIIGELDWRFNGHFSTWIKDQRITGKFGEAVYAPLKWNEKTFHFLVIGAGQVQPDGLRPPFSKSLQEAAKKKWQALNLGEASKYLFEAW